MINYLITALLAASPISECRGSIIYGLAVGLNPIAVYLISILANIAMIPIAFKLLEVSKIRGLVYRLFKSNIDKKIKKMEKKIDKYAELALLLFVAVPFPVTGAYTGVLIAYLLEMDSRKSFIAMAIGVVISATIVLLASLGFLAIPI